MTHSYDAYGNRTQSVFGGDLSATGDERSTAWDFRAEPLGVHRRPLVPRSSTSITTGALKAATRYRYDLRGAWDQPPAKGHVTETERWLDTEGRWTVATTRYDSWGNMISVKDETNREVTTTYDAAYHLFPQTVPDRRCPASPDHAWDPVCGLPYQHTDANDQMTTFQSDALCRGRVPTRPWAGSRSTFYRDFGDPEPAARRRGDAAGGSVEARTSSPASHFDGLGRNFYTVTKGPRPANPSSRRRPSTPRGQSPPKPRPTTRAIPSTPRPTPTTPWTA